MCEAYVYYDQVTKKHLQCDKKATYRLFKKATASPLSPYPAHSILVCNEHAMAAQKVIRA